MIGFRFRGTTPRLPETAVGLECRVSLNAQVFTASFAKRPKQIGFVLLPVFEITVKGMLTIPDAPGLGLTLNRDALRENEVSE